MLTTDIPPPPFSEANTALQQQLGEVKTVPRVREEECGWLTEERDQLATQLAEQKELLQRAQKEAEDKETALLAEFASERSSWTDKEAALVSGFQAIEDLVDGELLLVSFSGLPTASRVGLKFLTLFLRSSSLADFFPGHSDAANQAIEADREARRADGA